MNENLTTLEKIISEYEKKKVLFIEAVRMNVMN